MTEKKFVKTKTVKMNGVDIICMSVDFKEEAEWNTLYLANGDVIQTKLVITEVFDTGQKIEDEPVYVTKYQTLMRVISRGVSSTGEHIDTLHRQGAGDAEDGS